MALVHSISFFDAQLFRYFLAPFYSFFSFFPRNTIVSFSVIVHQPILCCFSRLRCFPQRSSIHAVRFNPIQTAIAAINQRVVSDLYNNFTKRSMRLCAERTPRRWISRVFAVQRNDTKQRTWLMEVFIMTTPCRQKRIKSLIMTRLFLHDVTITVETDQGIKVRTKVVHESERERDTSSRTRISRSSYSIFSNSYDPQEMQHWTQSTSDACCPIDCCTNTFTAELCSSNPKNSSYYSTTSKNPSSSAAVIANDSTNVQVRCV